MQHPNTQKWSNGAPPALPAGRASCLISSPSSPCVFGWLLHFYLFFGSRLRPWCIFVPDCFCRSIAFWGCCRHSCSRHQPPCQPTAVAVATACQRWRRRRCWQRGNKVNKDNKNNMTTTHQPTQQPRRQPTWRGNNWAAKETMFETMFF